MEKYKSKDFIVINTYTISKSSQLQIIIKSHKAFKRIKYLNHEIAEGNEYYNKRRKRNMKANNDFLELLGESEIYRKHMLDIMREEVSNGDK